MPNESSLPRWAQHAIDDLRRTVASQKREIELLRLTPTDGATGKVVADTLGGHDGVILPDRATIDFTLPGGKACVSLREDFSVLDFNSNGRTLLILPQASNSFKVRLG